MATTTNYGWTTPDDTALVKDGASAIRTLGTSVDTTTKALNPSTTLGDIEYRSSTANTNTRLGIGTTGQVLSVSGGVPAWSTISSGGMTLISTTTLTGASVGLGTIPTTYKDLKIIIVGAYGSAQDYLSIRLNSDSGATSYYYGTAQLASAYGSVNNATGTTRIETNQLYNTSTASYLSFQEISIPRYTDTSGGQFVNSLGYGGTQRSPWVSTGVYNNRSAAITAITLFPTSGTFTAGTAYLYGVS
jgi:hypothetical protein